MHVAGLHEGLQIQLPAQVKISRFKGFLMDQLRRSSVH